MNIETWLLFFGATFIATIIPGPSVLLGLNNGFIYGPKKSMATAFGITTAASIMGFVSLLGLGAILSTSGLVFSIIKYLGAIYLIFIGVKTWKSKISESNSDAISKNGSTTIKLFIQAVLVGFSNPKAIIFFTAFFPQFIDPNKSQINQFTVIIITLAFVVFLCMMIYIVGGKSLSPIIKKNKIRKLLNKITGGTFIGFGIGVALSDQ